MPRSRSSAVSRADTGWHGIEVLKAEDYLKGEPRIRSFFAERLSGRSKLEIEIGSGSGGFILNAAKSRPESFFVGIEYSIRFIKHIRDCVQEQKLENVMLVCTDAKFFLREALPDESVDVFHIYFPDPWPKRAQQHRRTLSAQNLLVLRRKLKPEGRLFFTTDSEPYYNSVQTLLSGETRLAIARQETVHRDAQPDASPDASMNYAAYGAHTQFGKKYLNQGRPIYTLTLVAS